MRRGLRRPSSSVEGEEQGPGLRKTFLLDRGFFLWGSHWLLQPEGCPQSHPRGHWGVSPLSQVCLGDTSPCPCRSFENNWNIYKLLAHQKPAQEKVRGDGEQQGCSRLGDTQGCKVPIPVPLEPLQHGHSERGSASRRHERCRALGRAHRHLPGTHHLRGERRLRRPGQGTGKGDSKPGMSWRMGLALGRGAVPTPELSLVPAGPRGGLARRGRMAGPRRLHAGHQEVSAALGTGA